MVLSTAQPGDINTVQYKHSGQPAVAGDKAGLYYQCWVTWPATTASMEGIEGMEGGEKTSEVIIVSEEVFTIGGRISTQ